MKNPTAEWLETDGLGGFASGSADGIRRRRYHAILIAALDPPAERRALVKGIELWLEGPNGRIPLSSQHYRGDVTHPGGVGRLQSFQGEPWPTFTFVCGDGLRISQELCLVHGHALSLLRFRAHGPTTGYRLHARLLLSGRDFHTLEHEDHEVSLAPTVEREFISFALRDSRARLVLRSNGRYTHAPDWYRGFLYTEERARGLDCEEDLASPGELCWELGDGDAVIALLLDRPETRALFSAREVHTDVTDLLERERTRRAQFTSPLVRAADAYVVRRAAGGHSLIAGYPWFGDWGRDTFIALRGIALATGRLELARDVLLSWANLISEGMLPNRFADHGDAPEYNTVDAALWYVIVAGELLAHRGALLSAAERSKLGRAIRSIIAGSLHGTRHGIRVDIDGLLRAGEPGVQLTWMDAKIGDWVVTARCGKPVEIQALWIAALTVGARLDPDIVPFRDLARANFAEKFWCEERGHLYDVIDVDHESGRMDASLRPNQLFALGALGEPLVSVDRAERALRLVERELLTPLGVRSLAPSDARYAARYEGGPEQRDAVYHQGTVWPFLLGAYVDAVLSLRGAGESVRRDLQERVTDPLRAHLETAGLHHVSEIADAEAPHTPRGCPFQAWSVGELLRVVTRLAAHDADRAFAA